jgi:hypothetical protein
MDRLWNIYGFLMKQYALIENNVVINTLVADDSFILTQSGEWIEYDDLRPAYIGTELIDGVLVAPKPFPSWSLNSSYDWQAPMPKPEGSFAWDEEILSWVEIPSDY